MPVCCYVEGRYCILEITASLLLLSNKTLAIVNMYYYVHKYNRFLQHRLNSILPDVSFDSCLSHLILFVLDII